KRMKDLPPEIETQAARLRCTTLRYLNIGARGQPPADWHWIYVPEQRYPFYRVNVFSTAMPSMAPPGCASICVEMADRGPIADAAVRATAGGVGGGGGPQSGAAGGGGRPEQRRRRGVRGAEGDRVRLRRVRPALLRGDAGHLRFSR